MSKLLTDQFAAQRSAFLANYTVLNGDFAGYQTLNGAGNALGGVTHTPTPGNLGINANNLAFTVRRDHPHSSPTCYFDLVPGGVANYDVRFQKNHSFGRKAAFHLPFKENLIVSIELTNAADFFFTANLSGCAIYVERDTVTNKVRVYHANAMALTLRGEDQGAQDYMDKLYMAARPVNSALISRCDRSLYNRQVAAFLARKHAKRRQNVATLGFTTFYGFRTGSNQWEFYFQTCARFTYTVPGHHPTSFGSMTTDPLSSAYSLLTWSSWPGTIQPVNKTKALSRLEVSRVPESPYLPL